MATARVSEPMIAIPDYAPPSLANAYYSLGVERAEAFYEHLIGGTSADYLSDWLERAGNPVSATTIKLFRQRMRREDEHG